MKYTNQIFKVIILITILSFSSCSTSDDNVLEQEVENTIIGRWHIVGFEQTTMYVFTENLRYTIYSTDGNFGGIETAIPNPNEWVFEGDELVIDLNFGNFSRTIPNFRCEGNVVDLVDANGGTTTLFRENYDINSCTE
ncbi:hypothetical protein DFQ05_1909 [Winogradskyella wandonensis]|uniref:Lipocalin-like protein n=1 Tax=Winogradskyella wandonensis TaxID=1442586 RepID=A0A4R1KNJ5_9FLAO|nr:hypothetical protein [Winogradskyella wandonensis]TCK66638.1 hypothetical protein DFQ05_1909 [Winogradskyella wandonensis]